ncbi:MAG: hypothetical protein IPP63_18855 [Chloracidobacterium sp.]|nr:hypothetical protein [Chloracidobacterium sp.]
MSVFASFRPSTVAPGSAEKASDVVIAGGKPREPRAAGRSSRGRMPARPHGSIFLANASRIA